MVRSDRHRVGLFLPQLRMDAPTIERRVMAAEEAGLDSVWFMDHMAPPMRAEADALEAWTLATWLAARTQRIRLGHLVLCSPFRHPAVMAKMAVTLDVLSGGRLELGLGWGSVPAELLSYGITDASATQRAAQLEDTIEVLRLMESGEPFGFKGRTLTMTEAIGRPVPVQGRIPLHIGGGGPKLTMPLVARHADWWNCPLYALSRLDELRAGAGNARVSLQRVVGIVPTAADRDEVTDLTRRRFKGWGGPMGDDALLIGTPEEVAAVLTEDRERGVDLHILQTHDFGHEASLALLGAEVLPALR